MLRFSLAVTGPDFIPSKELSDSVRGSHIKPVVLMPPPVSYTHLDVYKRQHLPFVLHGIPIFIYPVYKLKYLMFFVLII